MCMVLYEMDYSLLEFLSIVSQNLLEDISIIVAFNVLNIKWIIRIIICILYIISFKSTHGQYPYFGVKCGFELRNLLCVKEIKGRNVK